METVDTVTIVDLAPILAAVIGPIFLLAFAMMRHQQAENNRTRDLIDASGRENREAIENASRENREAIENASRENREAIDQLRRENREAIDKNHRETTGSLADVRERLARIEGHLGLQSPPTHDDGDAKAA